MRDDVPVEVRRDVDVAGLRISARTSRLPPPAGASAVVLVHGLGMSGRSMLPTLRLLAPAFSVWAPDLPGFGDSARPPRALDLDALADALTGWMDAVDLPRAAMLGNSLGCQVIARVATHSPTRLTRAVLVGPTRDPRAANALQQAGRLLLDVPREAPSLIPLAVYDYLRAGPGRMWRTLREAVDADVEQRADQVRVPVLVVRGEHDPIVPQRWARQLTDLLPDGRLVVVPGAAHAVNYSAPARLVEAVRPFLQSDRSVAQGQPVGAEPTAGADRPSPAAVRALRHHGPGTPAPGPVTPAAPTRR